MPWFVAVLLVGVAGAVVLVSRRSPVAAPPAEDEWRGVPVPQVGQTTVPGDAPARIEMPAWLGTGTRTYNPPETVSRVEVDGLPSRDVVLSARSRSRARSVSVSVGIHDGAAFKGVPVHNILRDAAAASRAYRAVALATWSQLRLLVEHLELEGVELVFASDVPADFLGSGPWSESSEDARRLAAGQAVRVHPLMFTTSKPVAARYGRIWLDSRGRWHTVPLQVDGNGVEVPGPAVRAPVHETHTIDLVNGLSGPDSTLMAWEERRDDIPRHVAQGDAQHIVTSVLYLEPSGDSMPFGPL